MGQLQGELLQGCYLTSASVGPKAPPIRQGFLNRRPFKLREAYAKRLLVLAA